MKFRFHCLGLPHTVTHPDYVACAYTQKVLKFCKMMTARGHTCIHYGHEDSTVEGEHVTVTTNDDLQRAYGSYDWRKNFFTFDQNDHAYQTFHKNAIKEINERKQEGDFLLAFWGWGVKPICDEHSDLIIIEPGIGYSSGHFSQWKIFESYALYHSYCGLNKVSNCNPNWYEVVIPNYFDLNEFEYNEEKEDYYLFLGRVYEGKGVHIASAMTEAEGVKLVVAGQKEEGYQLPDHIEYLGYADVETRKRLMKNAKALICPSIYNEPFGGVQIEALLSGTPTITTDWGAFTENNLHGITGYRCRTMGDFRASIREIENGAISSQACRTWGENYSLEKIAPMYEKYFQDVHNVYEGDGWYNITKGWNTDYDTSKHLSYNTKNYPIV